MRQFISVCEWIDTAPEEVFVAFLLVATLVIIVINDLLRKKGRSEV
ncbi:MAG: hypothetical protein WCV59_03170 [Parcubacteria group bacterium]